MPHTYGSLTVGDTFSWSRPITAADVQTFADVTGDDNPIHIDPVAAASSRFGQPVVHGVLLLGIASKVLGRDFPGSGSVAVSLEAKFLRPVPIGATLTIEVKVAEKIESRGHVRMRMYGYVGGRMVLGGEAVVIPPPDEEA